MCGVLVAALITKDEQDWLKGCVQSLLAVVDAVVVCDTGSSDMTTTIAKALGCHVVYHQWDADFAAARNTALDAAAALGATWVLSVDADEKLANVDVEALRSTLLSTKVDLLGVRLWNFQGPLANPVRKPASALVPRLFRVGKMRWVGRIHEHPRSVLTHSSRPIAEECTAVTIDHWGYCDEFLVDKRQRNLAISLAAWEETLSPVARFEYARSLSFAREHAEAKEHFTALFDDKDCWGALSPLRVRGTIGWLAVNALAAIEPQRALELAELALTIEGASGPPRLLKAQALFALGRTKEAYNTILGVTSVAEGYMLYDSDALEALRCVLAARCDQSEACLRSFVTLAENYPASKHTQAAFVDLACLPNKFCAIEILRTLPRTMWFHHLAKMPAVLAHSLADAAFNVEGPHKMPVLAWSKVHGAALPIDFALLWSQRLVDVGAPAQTPAHTISADVLRSATDRASALDFVKSC